MVLECINCIVAFVLQISFVSYIYLYQICGHIIGTNYSQSYKLSPAKFKGALYFGRRD
jgi:hypothetical protein